jgi:hypothetical protein
MGVNKSMVSNTSRPSLIDPNDSAVTRAGRLIDYRQSPSCSRAAGVRQKPWSKTVLSGCGHPYASGSRRSRWCPAVPRFGGLFRVAVRVAASCVFGAGRLRDAGVCGSSLVSCCRGRGGLVCLAPASAWAGLPGVGVAVVVVLVVRVVCAGLAASFGVAAVCSIARRVVVVQGYAACCPMALNENVVSDVVLPSNPM